ncbi:MAG: GNAT family N-acetyltransferase [Cyanobacteria bacterium J06633_2]
MTCALTYRPLANDQEKQLFQSLDAQCFVGSDSGAETYLNQVGAENFRVLCRSEQIVGGLCILPMRQWWGGQRVSMAGIAAVGIFPEYRGDGSAIHLMRSGIQELYDSGFAISVLYPATQRLYRKAGYEQGGTRCAWEIRTDQIGRFERSLPITPISPEPDVLNPIYEQYASQYNGLSDRHSSIWQQKLYTKADELIYGYGVGSVETPQGYVVFTQKRDQEGGILSIRDWTATTVEAATSLWNFLYGHRSQIDRVRWSSGISDPMLPLLAEQVAQMTGIEYWMLRIINVPLALEQRGYPPHVTGEFHFQVQDDGLEANTTSYVLTVEKGRGTVQTGGRSDTQLTIRALASLYSGRHHPQKLKWLGWLTGPDDSLAIAAQIFAGSPPWIAEFF